MKRILTTRRLTLVPFQRADINLLHETFTNAFVRRFLWDDQLVTRDQTEEILEKNEQYFQRAGWGLWKMLTGAIYVGFAGLWPFFDESQPQLLFGLLPDYTKRGYAGEAAQAVKDFAFGTLELQYLIASCDAPHVDSVRVCERLGMRKTEDRIIDGKLISFFRVDVK